MIDWLLQQQILLSMTLLTVMALVYFATEKLEAQFSYALWLSVPITLIVSNLPLQFIPVTTGGFSRYVVGVSPQVSVQHFNALGALWLCGFGSIILFVAAQYTRLARSLTKAEKEPYATYYSTAIQTPMLFGFLVPKVLLPENFNRLYCPRQQQLIIEHEQVHAHRFDHVWNLLALGMAAVFWFNPLMWIAIRMFRESQELACDQRVLVEKSSSDKLLYAKALVQCAEHTAPPLSFYPSFGEKSTMIKRLKHIKQPNKTSKIIALASVLIVGTITANAALANLPSPQAQSSKVNEATPVKRVSPEYPQQAVDTNQEGFVVLQFDITETGNTDNIAVIKSQPTGMFDKSATEALAKWQYKPRIQGGQAQRQTGLLVQLDFKLGPDAAMNQQPSKHEKIDIYSK